MAKPASSIQVLNKVQPDNIQLQLGIKELRLPLGRLVDGFLGGAGRAQADDQEGVDEVRDGEDS